MTEKEEPKKMTVTTFRLDPNTKEEVQRLATAERRSLNSMVNVLLDEAIAARTTQRR